MNIERRGFVAGLLGLLGLGGVARAKAISADPSVSFVVIELPITYEDPSAEQIVRFEERVRQTIPGVKFLVLSPGAQAKVIRTDGVYQREKLSEYEYEIVAKSEEDLKQRLADLGQLPSSYTDCPCCGSKMVRQVGVGCNYCGYPKCGHSHQSKVMGV